MELTIANTVDLLVGKDTSFMIVSPVTCLLVESRRKTIGIGSVVNKLRVNIVVDLNSVLICSTLIINKYLRSTREFDN